MLECIENLEKATSLSGFYNIKKPRGHPNVNSIRLGEYRLGFFLEGHSVILARFLHRKDIYRAFPI